MVKWYCSDWSQIAFVLIVFVFYRIVLDTIVDVLLWYVRFRGGVPTGKFEKAVNNIIESKCIGLMMDGIGGRTPAVALRSWM